MKLSLPRGASMPRIRPQAAISAAALVAPVLAVQVARLLFSSPVGPQAASAMFAEEGTAPVVASQPSGLPRLTAAQSRAMDWINTVRTEPMPPSPLLRAKPVAPAQATTVVPSPAAVEAPKVDENKIPEALTKLELTSVMRAGGSGAAMINGRMHRIGDVVIPGWTLTDVAFAERRVSLKNEAGLEVYLTQSE